MESNSSNVIPIGQGAVKLGRSFWSFRYPHEVVQDPSLGAEHKRAILAAWASDAHAVESFPTLRHLPGTPFPVTFSAVMDARLQLDRADGADDNDDEPPPAPPRIRRPTAGLPAQEAA
jgi:hypothetical protein